MNLLGNSGGPVVNSQNEVIGVAFQSLSESDVENIGTISLSYLSIYYHNSTSSNDLSDSSMILHVLIYLSDDSIIIVIVSMILIMMNIITILGYVVPVNVIHHFLLDVSKHGRYTGVCGLVVIIVIS